ncbi:MAG: hypothetical protein LBU94_01345 [Clostridiales bacterium]|jgi:alpha-tubulin suppressor-like RCC1 family protein|nr:hypothetical protein [Clostridiales bacterium]
MRKCLKILLVFLILFEIISVDPVEVFALGDNSSTISTGSNYTMAIKTDGTLWECGGYISSDSNYVKCSPSLYMGGVLSVSANNHTMVVKNDGSLWAWGNNDSGQLGDGTTTNRTSSVKIMDRVLSASAGDFFTMAIKTDGSLWAWGRNDNGQGKGGQLGDGSITDKHSPVKIMDNVSTVSAGNSFSMAIKNNKSLWAWGDNSVGQLGDGTEKDKHTPVKVLDDVLSVSVGNNVTMAIKTDGSLWAWGDNKYGQLGDGTTKNKSRPIKITDNVSSVSVGTFFVMAVKTDGSLWAWGNVDDSTREFFELVQQYENSPKKILDDVSSVSVGYRHTVAIKTDGSLWAWGNNGSGQLGDGTTTNRRNPIKIMDGVQIVAPALKATPISSNVLVNGKNVDFDAYLIDNNNYFKLRDLAYVLNGTTNQFDVTWNASRNTMSITADKPYVVVGGEMASKGLVSKAPIPSESQILLNGIEKYFTAYNIDGNNYFKLRDISTALNFGVEWDSERSIITIGTNTERTEDSVDSGNANENNFSEETAEQILRSAINKEWGSLMSDENELFVNRATKSIKKYNGHDIYFFSYGIYRVTGGTALVFADGAILYDYDKGFSQFREYFDFDISF